MKFTPAAVRALSLVPATRDHIHFDDSLAGFGVRVRAGSSQPRYVVQYAVAGRTRRVVLGPTTALELTAARAAAKDLLARIRLGADPAAEKAASRIAAADTFGKVLPAYFLWKQGQVRQRSLVEIRRHLEKYAKPLHARPLATIDRRSIAALINSVAVNSGPTAAKHLRQSLNAFFRWAIGEGFLEMSPVTFTNPPAVKPPRDRVPDSRELGLIWQALGDDRYSVILRLLLITSARRSEISDLRWSEVDLDGATITLPPGRTKNKDPHTIMLPRQAVALLRGIPRNSETVFGGVDGRGFQNWHAAKRELDARIARLNGGTALAQWTPHDFRRAASTWLHKSGVSYLVVEAILGHNAGGQTVVARTYNKATFDADRRRALQRWANHVTQPSDGKPAKVVSLPDH